MCMYKPFRRRAMRNSWVNCHIKIHKIFSHSVKCFVFFNLSVVRERVSSFLVINRPFVPELQDLNSDAFRELSAKVREVRIVFVKILKQELLSENIYFSLGGVALWRTRVIHCYQRDVSRRKHPLLPWLNQRHIRHRDWLPWICRSTGTSCHPLNIPSIPWRHRDFHDVIRCQG